MTTDFRALCAEGAAIIGSATDHDDLSIRVEIWAAEARAALAEPQPAADGDVAATGKPGLQVEPIPVSERLPELRGQFERIRCVARSSGGPAVGNIQLAGRLINAVRGWLLAHDLPLPKEVE